jgi:hypothetical protein
MTFLKWQKFGRLEKKRGNAVFTVHMSPFISLFFFFFFLKIHHYSLKKYKKKIFIKKNYNNKYIFIIINKYLNVYK